MMPPTNASIYWSSSGVRNGLMNSSAMSAPTGSDNPCTCDQKQELIFYVVQYKCAGCT